MRYVNKTLTTFAFLLFGAIIGIGTLLITNATQMSESQEIMCASGALDSNATCETALLFNIVKTPDN